MLGLFVLLGIALAVWLVAHVVVNRIPSITELRDDRSRERGVETGEWPAEHAAEFRRDAALLRVLEGHEPRAD